MCDAFDFTSGCSIFLVGRICTVGLRSQGRYSGQTISTTGRIKIEGLGQLATSILGQGLIAANFIFHHTLHTRMLVKISCHVFKFGGAERVDP